MLPTRLRKQDSLRCLTAAACNMNWVGPSGQSGPSNACEIAWPILSATATISRSPTWAYLNVILVLEWQRRRETTGTGTPFMMAQEA